MLNAEVALAYATKWIAVGDRFACAHELVQLLGEAKLEGMQETHKSALDSIHEAFNG